VKAINLLPPEMKARPRAARRLVAGVLVVVVLGLFLFWDFNTLSKRVASYQGEIRQARLEVEQYQDTRRKKEELDRLKALLAEREGFLGRHEGVNNWSTLLGEILQAAAPLGVEIRGITYQEGTTFVLRGRVPSLKLLAELMDMLEESPRVAEAELVEAARDTGKETLPGLAFEMVITVDPKGFSGAGNR